MERPGTVPPTATQRMDSRRRGGRIHAICWLSDLRRSSRCRAYGMSDFVFAAAQTQLLDIDPHEKVGYDKPEVGLAMVNQWLAGAEM